MWNRAYVTLFGANKICCPLVIVSFLGKTEVKCFECEFGKVKMEIIFERGKDRQTMQTPQYIPVVKIYVHISTIS